MSRRGEQAQQRQRAPRTWLLLGHKAGDNEQVFALAKALGWPFEVKRLAYRRTELLTNLLAGPNLLGIDGKASSPLAPPWPELVISAGRRNEPPARWIRQTAGGPGKVKLVHIGRSWAAPACFDLIVTTPQYHLPDAPEVLLNEAPLHRVTPARLAAAAAKWQHRVAYLPQPFVTVLLGGDVGPYHLDRENGALLGHYASRMAAELGGSLLVTTSARTSSAAVDALEEEIQVPAQVFRWTSGAKENPYLAYLALAERIVVTRDSFSMLAEAIAARKPTFIFDLARGQGSMRPPLPPGIRRRGLRERLADVGWQPLVHRIGAVAGPRRLVRDLDIIPRRQVKAGRAAWLGQPWPERPLPPPPDDMQRAAARVRALFAPVEEKPGAGRASVGEGRSRLAAALGPADE